MSAKAGDSQVFRINDRRSCEFTISPRGFCCEWTPGTPDRLTPDELERYRAARNEMVRRLTTRLGIKAMVVKL